MSEAFIHAMTVTGVVAVAMAFLLSLLIAEDEYASFVVMFICLSVAIACLYVVAVSER